MSYVRVSQSLGALTHFILHAHVPGKVNPSAPSLTLLPFTLWHTCTGLFTAIHSAIHSVAHLHLHCHSLCGTLAPSLPFTLWHTCTGLFQGVAKKFGRNRRNPEQVDEGDEGAEEAPVDDYEYDDVERGVCCVMQLEGLLYGPHIGLARTVLVHKHPFLITYYIYLCVV